MNAADALSTRARESARALTEEEPRSFADLAAGALDVTEILARIDADTPHSAATAPVLRVLWQAQRLARQVAEIAQRCDEPEDEPQSWDWTTDVAELVRAWCVVRDGHDDPEHRPELHRLLENAADAIDALASYDPEDVTTNA